MEGVRQFRLYTYMNGNITRKLCITIINKQMCLFLKNGRQKNRSCPRVGTNEREEGIRKG
jgi:hypothetical protein